MEFFESKCGDVPVIHVRGEVDHYASPVLALAAEQLLDSQGTRIAFDLSECSFMDSGGISLLFTLLARLSQGGWLAVIAPNPHLLRIFDRVGITNSQAFHVLSSEQELLNLGGEPRP